MITSNDVLTVIAIGLATIAAILLIVAIASARHAQRAAYYVVRRHEQQHANRQFAWSLALFAISASMFALGRIMPQASVDLSLPPQIGQATARPTANRPLSAAARAPTALGAPDTLPITAAETIRPTAAPSTATLTPTAARALTSTSTSTSTSTPTPTIQAAATPLARMMTLRAIGAEVGASGLPVSPTTEFTPGVRSVYVVYDYQNIPAGALIRHNWFRNGGSVHFVSFPWDRPVDGATHIVWVQRKPFQPGTYEVRVFVENDLQFVANFIVK